MKNNTSAKKSTVTVTINWPDKTGEEVEIERRHWRFCLSRSAELGITVDQFVEDILRRHIVATRSQSATR